MSFRARAPLRWIPHFEGRHYRLRRGQRRPTGLPPPSQQLMLQRLPHRSAWIRPG